jgi:CheY-like chemotaxis protein
MKDIIDWLIGVEDAVCEVYERASFKFTEDKELAGFLLQMSKDEKEHSDFTKEAKKHLEKRGYPSHISLDNETKQKIETPLIECNEKLDKGDLTKRELINYIVAIEYSEFNHILLYAIGTLKSFSYRYYYDVLKSIQHHKMLIENFIERQPESDEWLKRIKRLPKVGDEKVLVVDDYQMVVELLKAMLNECIVEGASNGEEALQKINDKYYAAIITDVNMPVMNGIEFYNRAIERYPDIKKRFLFFTTAIEPEHLSFFKDNNLRYIIKPSPINVLRKTIIDILIR